MTKQIFDRACWINEQINTNKAILNRVKKESHNHKGDDWIYQTAYEAIDWKIQMLQKEFDNL